MKARLTLLILLSFTLNPLMAEGGDPHLGDWLGTVTLDQQTQPVAVFMIPRGAGRYEARFVADFQTRGPYLHRLQGEIRDGRFRFLDDIPLEPGRVTGTVAGGVVLDASLWSGDLDSGSVRGAIAGRRQGAFELRRGERTSPDLGRRPPPDAVVLFDGTSLDPWRHREAGKAVAWRLLPDQSMEVNGGDIVSQAKFGDHVLHLEFCLPYMPEASGQGRANSGVYLQGRYEVQVLDSYGLEGEDNECGGIYRVSRPDVNACAPPLQWQSYDIEFRAARFDDGGRKTAPARVTVRHNGLVIHQDRELPAPTGGALDLQEDQPQGLMLQDHGNPVRYRNLWVRPR